MILHVLVHAQRCSDSESEYSFSTPPGPNGDALTGRLHLATSIINSPVSLRACLIALGTRTVDSEVFRSTRSQPLPGQTATPSGFTWLLV
jgi:hypothetical protein